MKIIKTAVYIDGYNLYYNRLRGSEFKWLDVVALFDHLLKIQAADSYVASVQLFTAPALANFATRGQVSTHSQQSYHRALCALNPNRFKLIFGNHTFSKAGTLLPTFVPGQRFDRNLRSRVWKLEEKLTDVNLALAMYRDAAAGHYQHAVLCTNDSDQSPTLIALREDFPELRIGVVAPLKPTLAGEGIRRVSASLMASANWTRRYLLDDELLAAQLPAQVATFKAPARKPEYW